jgi:hypothetical protein
MNTTKFMVVVSMVLLGTYLIYHQVVKEVYGIPQNYGTLSAKTQSLYWKCLEAGPPFTEQLCDYMYLRYGKQFDEYFKCEQIFGKLMCDPQFPEITTPGGIQGFSKGTQEGQQQQKLEPQSTAKDCPAIQHLHSGKCVDNADHKAHGSTFNENRSSTLDCASNEFVCKSEGLE